jgi:cation-transporting P-type ATPase I
MGVGGLLRSSALLSIRATAVVATVGLELVTAPVRVGRDMLPIRAGETVARALSEIAGGTPRRRSWARDGRMWIEIRGVDGDRDFDALLDAVRARHGVVSAQINRPLSRLVVQVDDDGPTMDEVCDIVADAEADTRQSGEGTPRRLHTQLPADGIARTHNVIAATASAAGLVATLAGRALHWPRLPAGVAAPVTVVDFQPRLRRPIEDWLGPSGANTALAIAASVVYTVTQAPASLAVDLMLHLARAAESTAESRAWERREPDLALHARCDTVETVRPRPRPRPPGPVERYADRCGIAQAVGATAVGTLTRSWNAAATAALVAAPKAARSSREMFASTLGRQLAARHGVLPLHPEALRRLDRVDTVLVDPRALCIDELRVSRIRGSPERDRAAIWDWARQQIDSGKLTTGWHSAAHPSAEVLIRHVHHPLASATLAEVRRAGAEVVSVDADPLGDLRSMFDDIRPGDGPLDDALREAVDHYQREGRTVAVLSAVAPQALSAADVAIGLLSDRGPPWQAHLLVDELADAWRIVHSLPAARRASERGVEIAAGSSLLGALLMVPGVRGAGPGPVTAGQAAGMLTAYRLARNALRDPVPAPAPSHEWHAMPTELVREILPPPVEAEPAPKSRLPTSPGAVGRARRGVVQFALAMRDELSDPLTPVLAVGSAASALLGSPIDAVLVGSVLVGNAALASTQRLRSERLLTRLLAVQDPPARRVADYPVDEPRYENVDAARLRLGDLIEIRPSEVIPADARLIAADDVEVDESSLTGESLPVAKQVAATPGAELAERSCMVYAGTTVVAGSAVAVVTAIGAQMEIRRAAEIPGAQSAAVGLSAQLKELTNRALPVSIGGGALVSVLGLARNVGLRQAIASGVAVCVAAVPEGLPLVATLAQQASARRLTRQGALVRSPRSVEALGRVDVVCFDKTGTLSENRLRVTRVHTASGFSRADVLTCAAQATPPQNGRPHEHATDVAVVEAAPGPVTNGAVAAAYLPFRSGRPYSASVVGRTLCIKGAPEVILDAASAGAAAVEHTVGQMAMDGLRVIAVARRDLTEDEARAAREDPDQFASLCDDGLQITGLLGLSDTPRAESAGVLAALEEQQIGIRLITGDHPVTAAAIAAELGMPVEAGEVIGGDEWATMPRRAQEQAVRDRRVFARMSPEHKVQIVQTLERTGHVCAMVGDGANDAAAIRAATVGVGVASRGSDPARTAADVMLLDGRIEALLDALDEGGQLWRRVQAAVAVLLGGNAGEVAFAIAGSAVAGRSPLNTRQLLLVNMLTDALPAAALAVSPLTEAARNGGRGPDQAALWRTVAVRGTTTAAAATTAWVLARLTGRSQRASTVALVALVSTQLGQTLLDSRSPLVVSTAVGSLLVLAAIVSTPGVSQLLGSTPLGPVGWIQALGTAALATAAAAVVPRLLAKGSSEDASDGSTIFTTPARQSTAYTSRNGRASSLDTASVNGSADTPSRNTSPTVGKAFVQTPNST